MGTCLLLGDRDVGFLPYQSLTLIFTLLTSQPFTPRAFSIQLTFWVTLCPLLGPFPSCHSTPPLSFLLPAPSAHCCVLIPCLPLLLVPVLPLLPPQDHPSSWQASVVLCLVVLPSLPFPPTTFPPQVSTSLTLASARPSPLPTFLLLAKPSP